MNSQANYKDIAEVIDLTETSMVVRVQMGQYAKVHGIPAVRKDYFIPFKQFPWFLGASDKEIRTVKVKWDALFWTLLGFDCEVESIEHPEDFPLCYFTLAHRKRIAVYVNSCKNKPETEEVKVARCYLKHHLPIYEWVRLRRGVDF